MNIRFPSAMKPRLLRLPLYVCLAAISGCMPLAALMSKVTPEPVKPAQYAPKTDNMLVLVEDFQNPASIMESAEEMDRQIAEALIANKAAPIVNPDLLTELRTAKAEEYRKMPLPAIGRAVGAKQILYANVVQFATDSGVGNQMLKAHAEARVRIVDTATGQTRWPLDAAGGYPVTVDIPFAPTGADLNETTIREKLSRQLSDKIARLFYGASVDQVDGTEPELEMPHSGISGHI
ncbi:MAG TPA: hypothetical protein VFC78_09675 [Tepidisphaeraceae bacterium]|nr:hypothetical protein [Tepidisphaeraceae bacterium]